MSKGMTFDLYQDDKTVWSELIIDGVVHRYCRDKTEITEEIGFYNDYNLNQLRGDPR